MSIGAHGHTTRPGRTPADGPGRGAGSGTVLGRFPLPVPDRIWVPAAAALVLAVLFVAALLIRADGDVSLLVHAGPPWTSADTAPDSLTVQEADEAFDGQFFYRLGVAPWTTDEVVAGVTNDLPSLRNARWGYGALAWAASGGDTDLVPWSLVGLNVVAMAAVAAIGGGLARASGRHAAWGLLFALWPGFAYSLSMDTSELVASAFVLGGLLALRRELWLPAAVLFGAAVITRDTTAVVPAGVALAGAGLWLRTRTSVAAGRTTVIDADGDRGTPSDHPPATGLLLAGTAPLVLFGAWQLIQRARFGSLPLTSSGDNNLSVPFGGLLDQLGQVVPPSGGEELFRLVCIVGLMALLIAAGWTLGTTRRATTGSTVRSGHLSSTAVAERWVLLTTWVPAVVVVVVLNAYLWSGATAFMRAATEAGLLSTLVLLVARGRRADRLLAAAGLGLGSLWLLTAVAQLTKLG